MNTYPVHVRARPDAPGRWLWLVKWLLLVPHYLVLAVLWVAFVAMTVAGYVAVLFTGRYPRGIFDFNVGVLRWSWRVGYYGYQVLGTDRYPPFTLAQDPDYPADLYIEHPGRIPRYQPLVAWLLALPHALLLGAIAGAGWQASDADGWIGQTQIGLVGIAVLIAGIALAATGRYPRGLHDLLTGVARWGLRVVAYVALLTRRYPPFRLDQGDEPVDPDAPPPAGTGTVAPWIAPSAPLSKPVSPPGPGGTAIRVAALVAGVLVMLTGLFAGLGGGVLLAVEAVRDADGYATSRPLVLATPTAAVTSQDVTVAGTDTWRLRWGDFGKVRVTATAPGETALFLGVARASDVDRWLSGTARDELTRGWDRGNPPAYHRTAGDLRPVSAPTDQTFWVTQVSGTGTIQLEWDALAANGDYVFVLANADGSSSVAARTRLGVNVPALVPLGTSLLVTAGLFVLVGFVLVYGGASGLGRHHGGPPSPTVGPVPPAGPTGTATSGPPVRGAAAATPGT
ncbi:DUF4389 domain-containing protein [Dactylosporangium sp. NPDC050688]|uniref:DUF4389 domain-containing protein n=1 Tax=Dactylosporangium sp. NPDC050688 TaxID=3157217 RepID=UPI0033F7F1C6